MDIGGLLVGIAALGTLLLTISTRHKHSRQLAGIDAAVNGKAPDEPYMREYVVDTARAVGRIEQKFDDHAADDSRRFAGISAALDDLVDLRDLLRELHP